MSAQVWYSITDGNWNATSTWSLSSGGSAGSDYPKTGDRAIIEDGDTVTLTQAETCGQLQLQNNGEIVGGGNVLTLDSASGIDMVFTHAGDISTASALNVKITGINSNGDRSYLKESTSSGAITNLELDDSGATHNQSGDLNLLGNFTITAGTWDTSFGGSNHALTVTGATTIGDGSSSADTATLTCNASEISLGSGVTGTHSFVVQAGGTFTGGTGTHTLGSLNIKNSTAAKCTLSSGNTTINGEGSANKAINIEGSNGTTNFAHGSGTVIITHDGASDIKADGVTLALNNLTINHASANINLKSNLSVAGNLVISAGELDTDSSNFALTVTGATSVTGTLTCNNSTISLGSGLTSAYGLTVNTGGTFVGGGGTHTFGGLFVADHASADCTLTSGNTTINGENSDNYNFTVYDGSTLDNADGTVIFTGPTSQIYLQSSATVQSGEPRLHNLTLNSSSNTLTLGHHLTVEGDLEINAGTLDTESSNNRALTVTGEMHSQGTFNGNSSTVTVRNLLIEGGTFNSPDGSGMLNITGEGSSGLGDGYAFRRVSGAFVDNTGTVTFKTPTTTSIRMGTPNQDFYNVIFDESSTGGVYSTNDEGFTVTNDCTLTDGDFDTTLGTATPLIDIQGDLTIGANNTFGGITQTQTSDISFGSLTIASGGTYNATSGTTTITGEASSGFNLSNSGTFTHNKGTVKVTCATQTTLTGFSGSNAFFNFTYAGTGSGQDQICGANTDFFGQVVIDSANSEVQMQQHTFNLYDGIKIKQGGWDIGSSSTSGTINVYGAVRNVGGTVVAS